MWHGDWSWWSWVWMSGVMVAFWGFLIWRVVTLFRRDDTGETDRLRPEDRLAERFARGEITEDEYRQRLDVLRGDRGEVAAATSAIGKEDQR